MKRKRFSIVNLARVSDMHSTFNPSAVGSIAKCEGGKVKGEMGLLCSELSQFNMFLHDVQCVSEFEASGVSRWVLEVSTQKNSV